VGDQGDVSVYQSSGHRIVEGASDDEVHLQHGLWRQWPPSVGGVEHPIVECLQVLGPEPSHPQVTDGWEDVPVDLPYPSQVDWARLIFLP
jgi:hypothetical protein